jgi:hypothetical protein
MAARFTADGHRRASGVPGCEIQEDLEPVLAVSPIFFLFASGYLSRGGFI